MIWNKVKIGDILTESKVESANPDPDKRITVRLNMKGVEKRPFEAGVEGGTKYYIRKAGQFIYGKQNLFKGAFGIIPKELDGFESSQDIPTFDISSKCLPEWIYYFLKQGDFYKSLESIATGTGSRRIQPARLFEVEISFPSIPEQRKILLQCKLAEDKYEQLISELELQQTHLQQLRQAILQEAVQGKLTKQDPNDEPAEKLLQRIKAEKQQLIAAGKLKKEKELPPITEDEVPFELPKSWVWCRLGEIVSLITKGSSPKWQGVEYVEDGLLFVTSENVDSYKIDLTKKKYVQWKFNEIEPRSILKKGDFLMNIVGGSIGRTALYDLDEVANINQAVCLIRKESELIDSMYLLHFFNSPVCISYMYDKQVDNARPNLSMSNIERFLIPLPPLSEQQRIVAKVEQLMQMVNELEQQVQQNKDQAGQLLQAVLKEAFSGKVKEYEMNDEVTMAAEG